MNRKVFTISVVSSIFASIAFSWLLDPLTRWIWHVASENALSWFTNLQNAAFSNAAIGKRDWLVTVLFLYAFAFGFASFLGITAGALSASLVRSPRGERYRRLRPKLLLVSCVVLALVLTYSFGRLGFLAYVDLQLNASFSQRLDALGPYIEPMEERRLRSAWALMKTRSDYEMINRRIDELAVAANITIPEPLLK
jgi:amino acid transporter